MLNMPSEVLESFLNLFQCAGVPGLFVNFSIVIIA